MKRCFFLIVFLCAPFANLAAAMAASANISATPAMEAPIEPKEAKAAKSSKSSIQEQKQENKETLRVSGARPAAVQAAIDKAFEKIKVEKRHVWSYAGAQQYNLLGLNDRAVIKNLASPDREEKDIYILDVGCGNGAWGSAAMEIDKEFQKAGKLLHVFSVTGGNDCNIKDAEKCEDKLGQKYYKVVKGNTEHYLFNQFKIENIDQEFSTRGFDLRNKVHLIVSRQTLRHLVDPLGTLKRMYSLLAPQGILISSGFFLAFKDDKSEEAQTLNGARTFPRGTRSILAATHAIPLFYKHDDFTTNDDEFLLKKIDTQEFVIPQYTGKMLDFMCSSGVVTVFEKGEEKDPGEAYDFDEHCYCEKGNLDSIKLYEALKKQQLFDAS